MKKLRFHFFAGILIGFLIGSQSWRLLNHKSQNISDIKTAAIDPSNSANISKNKTSAGKQLHFDKNQIADAEKQVRSGNLPVGKLLALYSEWGKVAPLDAINALSPYSDNKRASSKIAHVLKGWFEAEPAQAVGWVHSLMDGQFKESLLASLSAAAVSFSDSGKMATQLAMEISDPQMKTIAYREILEKLSENQTMSSLADWYMSLPESGGSETSVSPKKDALEKLISLSLQTSFQESKEIISKVIASGTTLESVVHAISPSAMNAPDETIQLLDGVTGNDPSSYGSSYMSTFSTWAMNDYNGLGEWLQGNRSHFGYDVAAYQYIRAIRKSNPKEAYEWANTLQNKDFAEEVKQNLDSNANLSQMAFPKNFLK